MTKRVHLFNWYICVEIQQLCQLRRSIWLHIEIYLHSVYEINTTLYKPPTIDFWRAEIVICIEYWPWLWEKPPWKLIKNLNYSEIDANSVKGDISTHLNDVVFAKTCNLWLPITLFNWLGLSEKLFKTIVNRLLKLSSFILDPLILCRSFLFFSNNRLVFDTQLFYPLSHSVNKIEAWQYNAKTSNF